MYQYVQYVGLHYMFVKGYLTVYLVEQLFFFRAATDQELKLVHEKNHIQAVKTYSSNAGSVCKLAEQWKTYTSDHTYTASVHAVGSLLSLIDAIYKTKVSMKT